MNSEPLHTDAAVQSRPDFDAVLEAHRSLGPRGFLIFMGMVSVVSFAAGLYFAQLGAWPVFGFFGLDVLLIYGAFRLNYRAARAKERVTLVGEDLVVTETLTSSRTRSCVSSIRPTRTQ